MLVVRASNSSWARRYMVPKLDKFRKIPRSWGSSDGIGKTLLWKTVHPRNIKKWNSYLQREFELHIWSVSSIHEYYTITKYEGPTPSAYWVKVIFIFDRNPILVTTLYSVYTHCDRPDLGEFECSEAFFLREISFLKHFRNYLSEPCVLTTQMHYPIFLFLIFLFFDDFIKCFVKFQPLKSSEIQVKRSWRPATALLRSKSSRKST